ncbi:MAG: PH domain-containing protein [Nocardioides sp.]
MPDERLESRGWSRPSAKLVIASYLESTPSLLGLLIAWTLLNTTQLESIPGWIVQPAIVAILLLRICLPWYELLATKFRQTDSELIVSRGLLMRTIRTTPWSEISSISTTESWGFRFFNIVKLDVQQRNERQPTVSLPGVSKTLASRLVKARSRPVDHVVSESDGRRRDVIYRASAADLVITSMVLGKFLVAGGGILLATVGVLSDVGVLGRSFELLRGHGAIAICFVVILSMFGGAVVTTLRYWGFRVLRAGDAIELSYGLINTNSRFVRSENLVGITIKRSLLECMTNRARLLLIAEDARPGIGVNLTLPSLRTRSVLDLASQHFDEFAENRELLARELRVARVSIWHLSVVSFGTLATTIGVYKLSEWGLASSLMLGVASGYALNRLLVAPFTWVTLDSNAGLVRAVTRTSSVTIRIARERQFFSWYQATVFRLLTLRRLQFQAGRTRSIFSTRDFG